ncbi:beta-lactamase family protein [Streptomyces sp. KA12]|uniref:serine hydrolase n=1 Tax=Streptomyces sp. KA12 TaxID=2991730 RepID=UPI0023B11E45|nr:serine hydrolase [Streptomyces sp. KA12]MDF0376145.1 beta-lactamase family protein [Streptomyces sp. KA12]
MTETAPLSDLSWTRGYTDPAWIRRFTTSGREISPSRRVWRGAGRPRDLPGRSTSSHPGTHELDTVPLELNGRAAVTLPDLFAAAQTDAFLVLHRGSVVYERYLDGIEGHTPHFNASAAKSYIGLVAAVLAHQGHLDRTLQTSFYVPELAGTAFGEARIEDLLHMGTQVSYGGRRFDKAIEAQRFFAVLSPRLRPFDYNGPTTIREHLLTARAAGAPGTEFCYENGNVEALAESYAGSPVRASPPCSGNSSGPGSARRRTPTTCSTVTASRRRAGASAPQHATSPASASCCAAAERSATGRWCPRPWPRPSSAASATAMRTMYASPVRP